MAAANNLIFISHSRISGASKQLAKRAICTAPKTLARSLQPNLYHTRQRADAAAQNKMGWS
jgi:hypothetical protein